MTMQEFFPKAGDFIRHESTVNRPNVYVSFFYTNGVATYDGKGWKYTIL